MAVEIGDEAPDFELPDQHGTPVKLSSFRGAKNVVLVFYPLAFSPVCTEQFTLYQEVLDDLRAQGADLYGVSCDSTYALHAFREQLGVEIPMLSDFHPKGEATRAWGLYREQNGFPERAIVITGPDRTVRMTAARRAALSRPGRGGRTSHSSVCSQSNQAASAASADAAISASGSCRSSQCPMPEYATPRCRSRDEWPAIPPR